MPPMSFIGLVTSAGKMSKTATVTVTRKIEHPVTRKLIERSKKYLTHDPEEVLRINDKVLIRNCPPVSARKRFKLEKIVSRPKAIGETNASVSP
ncbi:hypothetical protein FRC02_008065 [Tulasnella sp. 418]|nr:hypothetical protein FRC02_008065 [Tulasnella sp. 418]